jgi:hypothetical protein
MRWPAPGRSRTRRHLTVSQQTFNELEQLKAMDTPTIEGGEEAVSMAAAATQYNQQHGSAAAPARR